MIMPALYQVGSFFAKEVYGGIVITGFTCSSFSGVYMIKQAFKTALVLEVKGFTSTCRSH